MKKLTAFIFLLSLLDVPAKANQRCEETLEANFSSGRHTGISRDQISATQNLIAYLSALLEQQIIGVPEILRFIDGLEKNDLVNPIDEYQTWTSSASMIHRDEIENYLGRNDLDRMILLTWASKILAEKTRAKDKREEAHQETKGLHQKMQFHPLPPGTFMMGDYEWAKDEMVKVTLTHRTEAMSTLVTQYHWVEVMGENPSYFDCGEDHTIINVRGRDIMLQPDHPVENITWWSALVFANRLSEIYGYLPAYNLSMVRWEVGTKAENGSLAAESGVIKLNAPIRTCYRTKGFRLPTEAEQEFLLRAAGTAKVGHYYYFEDNKEELKDHAWYYDNSNFKTHAVAQLKPLVHNGNKFFDVLGNVAEWSSDFYFDDLQGGVNPDRFKNKNGPRVIRSSYFYSYANDCDSSWRYERNPNERAHSIGLRLFRTIDEK